MVRWVFLLTALPTPALAGALQNYDAVCTAPCVVADGTIQPIGTVLKRVMWDGQAAYKPGDAIGNLEVVNLVADPSSTKPVFVPKFDQAPKEWDCTLAENGKCAMPSGTTFALWTNDGGFYQYSLFLPPQPSPGRSAFEIFIPGGVVIKKLTVQTLGGSVVMDGPVGGPKVYRARFTNRGWLLLPN